MSPTGFRGVRFKATGRNRLLVTNTNFPLLEYYMMCFLGLCSGILTIIIDNNTGR